jgi:hypothetical protein
MKKGFLLLLICFIVCYQVKAQEKKKVENVPLKSPLTPAIPKPKAKKQLVSFILHVPIGAFAKSHLVGAGLNYSWSQFDYGKNKSTKKIGFTANGGIDYYLGEKKEIADHDFIYGGYTYLYAQGGAFVHIYNKTIITLTAGPAMGVYKGNSDFGVTSSLFGAFYLPGTRFVIGPGITFKKHKETDPLWTAAARLSYFF